MAGAARRHNPQRRDRFLLPTKVRGQTLSRSVLSHIRFALVLVGICVMGACGSSGTLSADSPIFDGLPQQTVEEALANPHLQRNLEGDEDQQRQQSIAQASVRNIIYCREQLRIYETWLTTGTPPEPTRPPVPDDPLEPGNAAIEQDYAMLENAIESGDPSVMKQRLTANGSCGQWVPATPGDTEGPTIAEEAQSL